MPFSGGAGYFFRKYSLSLCMFPLFAAVFFICRVTFVVRLVVAVAITKAGCFTAATAFFAPAVIAAPSAFFATPSSNQCQPSTSSSSVGITMFYLVAALVAVRKFSAHCRFITLFVKHDTRLGRSSCCSVSSFESLLTGTGNGLC